MNPNVRKVNLHISCNARLRRQIQVAMAWLTLTNIDNAPPTLPTSNKYKGWLTPPSIHVNNKNPDSSSNNQLSSNEDHTDAIYSNLWNMWYWKKYKQVLVIAKASVLINRLFWKEQNALDVEVFELHREFLGLHSHDGS